jgi:hypothetical protein
MPDGKAYAPSSVINISGHGSLTVWLGRTSSAGSDLARNTPGELCDSAFPWRLGIEIGSQGGIKCPLRAAR